MSYEVLARKWRPRQFSELVGQSHVVQALSHALDNDRVHHAFLFSGTRGVGKTTIARIVAKSLNCEQGMSATPCGQCASCTEIDEGRFVDLIEVDAASRTKVDDTRELLDNVQYAPTRGRFKVYLIDEVHMLSGHSFNALLKTLEEPPPHVKFLLATTNPKKLPVTVLSRCLQFNLKRLSPESISGQLDKILKSESVAFEAGALQSLARTADGSMRDALSLLDQAIAFCGGKVQQDCVHDMLGTIDQRAIVRSLNALLDRQAPELLQIVQEVIEQGRDCDNYLSELLLALHHISILQAGADVLGGDIAELETLQKLAQLFNAEDIQLFYQIGLMGRRDLSLAPDPRTGLEMVLLRMLVFQPQADVAVTQATIVPAKTTAPSKSSTAKASVTSTAKDNITSVIAADDNGWGAMIEQLPIDGLLREFAINLSLDRKDDKKWQFTLDENCARLLSKDRQMEFSNALQQYCGHKIAIDIAVGKPANETPAMQKKRIQHEQHQQAIDAIEDDANVQSLVEQFGARINSESIRPK
ncbi:MAG TPA: DNA polymerase III subunit gamma/tau [Acidiferrobacteraceae bacterium]|jgi:DNA polymerase III subunit gamma/tau|nr:DNA polymerase III subunit gamma/tau [Acidiferrobacteraceae bacterium]HEX20083.1 DNA polymerase III subunit gamma/tau [Acidiferrobacteraceae bacterium]